MSKLIKAKTLKAFSSTVLGNLDQGQEIEITQHRFNVWKEQGLVDLPEPEKEDKPQHKKTTKPKKATKRTKKAKK